MSTNKIIISRYIPPPNVLSVVLPDVPDTAVFWEVLECLSSCRDRGWITDWSSLGKWIICQIVLLDHILHEYGNAGTGTGSCCVFVCVGVCFKVLTDSLVQGAAYRTVGSV